MPHHGVVKESKTTPVRVVYDCSAKSSKSAKSLNDHLLSGPPVINDLVSLLMRFRTHKYAVIGDIEKAFLQIKLDEVDRDFTRFIWLTDPKDPQSPLKIYRFCVVLFGATSSPFILGATIKKHLNEHNNEISEDLNSNLYVDNLISGRESEHEIQKYKETAEEMMKAGGFNLREWVSNCASFQSHDTSPCNVLGLIWDPAKDTLAFKKKEIPTTDVITKRSVFKQSSQLFDPLGLITPITIRAKLFIQKL